MRNSSLLCLCVFILLAPAHKLEAAPSSTTPQLSTVEEIYASKCGHCHDGPIANAPHRFLFSMSGPNNVYQALSSGVMKEQAAGLSEEQIRALSEYLGESALTDSESPSKLVQCASGKPTDTIDVSNQSIKSWGFDLANTRWLNDGMTRDQIERLKVKWVFAYPEATRARSQPTIDNGTVYVGSQNGTVYALDLETGCVHWTYQAQAEVRTALTISNDKNRSLFFGDFDGTVYSISATNGRLNWLVELPDHEALTITGTPTLFNDVLYVPLSSREWVTAADPAYQCCSFRGGVVALNIDDGSRKWVSYTIDEAQATDEKNSAGLTLLAPSGASVWHSPIIDEKRNRLYIGTGQNYSSPASDTSDAILALDLDSGKIAWSYQATAGDAWNMACFLGGSNCPEKNGPDYDFGAPPILAKHSDGNDIILAGQKSGDIVALSADDGEVMWKKRISLGGIIGGIHWGMSTDGETLFVPISDWPNSAESDEQRLPGLFSVDAASGEVNWYTATNNRCLSDARASCDQALSASITGTPAAIFAGGLDGYLYAYDTKNGEVIWEYSTDTEFESVSGEVARGGSIESDGPVVFENHLLVNSGYSFAGHLPGNALIVFSVDGK